MLLTMQRQQFLAHKVSEGEALDLMESTELLDGYRTALRLMRESVRSAVTQSIERVMTNAQNRKLVSVEEGDE